MPPAVVILCGGLGTRLRSIVSDRPKVLAPIHGRPFLDYLLRYLEREGVDEVVLSTGHLGHLVEQFVAESRPWRVRIRCIQEQEPLGTAGAFRYAAESLGLTEPFVGMNGDTFFNGSLNQLCSFHLSHTDTIATLALAWVPRADRYGSVQIDDTGAILGFHEKQPLQVAPAWINAGVYVLTPELLAGVAPGHAVSLERDVLPHAVGKGLLGYRYHDAVFLDIGTPEDYRRAGDILPFYLSSNA